MRKKFAIKVEGIDTPNPIFNFTKILKKYNISHTLGDGIAELGFQKPTPVQSQVIPCFLERRNTLVTAPTGTGKTLSFLLPISAFIEQNCPKSKKIEAVIITPLQ